MEGKVRILIDGLRSLESILWSVRSNERFLIKVVDRIGKGLVPWKEGKEEDEDIEGKLEESREEAWTIVWPDACS